MVKRKAMTAKWPVIRKGLFTISGYIYIAFAVFIGVAMLSSVFRSNEYIRCAGISFFKLIVIGSSCQTVPEPTGNGFTPRLPPPLVYTVPQG